MISKNNVNSVPCDGVSVAIFLYNKTIILDLAFLIFAKINKVLEASTSGSADNTLFTSTLIIPDITQTFQ